MSWISENNQCKFKFYIKKIVFYFCCNSSIDFFDVLEQYGLSYHQYHAEEFNGNFAEIVLTIFSCSRWKILSFEKSNFGSYLIHFVLFLIRRCNSSMWFTKISIVPTVARMSRLWHITDCFLSDSSISSSSLTESGIGGIISISGSSISSSLKELVFQCFFRC